MKAIKNSYLLENKSTHMPPEDIRRSLSDFEFFMGRYQQITNKSRQVVPFKLNLFQKRLFETVLPLVEKKTRKNKRHSIVLVKSRQVGASVSVVALINYICAFVDGMHDITCLHIFPVADTVSKFYNKKVEPIISGVHPDLFPNIERETLGSSIMTHYKDIKGIRRNCYYELVSSGASSIRSDSVHLALFDEFGFYSHPDVLEDAVGPALPDDSWSLVIYLSTFEDRKSDAFLHKIQTARDNPEDWTLVFAPWYWTYPETKMGVPLESIELTEYDETVILPALQKDNIPKEEWGDCIDWYHRKKLTVSNMMKEFPTTIDEVLTMNQDKGVFSKESIEKQRKNIYPGTPYRMVTDTITGKVEAIPTDSSPVMVYKQPHPGHKYLLCCDPITASNEDTDFFTMTMMDLTNNEQVATFRGKEYATEDYAEFAICLSKLYGRALICPEKNVAEGFVACIRGKGYYNFYYVNEASRKNRDPGIRTTVSSKENMIDRLRLLLDTDNIILHDKKWVDELEWFEKKTKTRTDGSVSVKMAARKSKTDDCVSCFTGDTLVMTDKGEKPISKIKIGDMVLTSKGFRPVDGISKRIAEVETKFGISATPNHVFVTPDGNQEWTDINIHSKIYVCPNKKELRELMRRTSDTMAKSGQDGLNLKDANYESTISAIINGRSHRYNCIGKFMKTISGIFRKDIISTIKTAIQITIPQRILNVSLPKRTYLSKAKADGGIKNGGRIEKNTMRQKSILKMLLLHKKIENKYCTDAKFVGKSFCQDAQIAAKGSVQIAKSTYIQTKMGNISKKSGKLKNSEELYSHTRSPYLKKEIVYNLSVNGVHEFYANGILVHNCSWIFAGSLSQSQLTGQKRSTFSVL